MSVSCVGTCSACGVQRFWLSDTLSLQMDDGTLKCLRHPREDFDCEREGLTLTHASERGRLYVETFYVCRHCGRTGETIEPRARYREPLRPLSVSGTTKFGLLLLTVVVPIAAWFQWWDAVRFAVIVAVVTPVVALRENRKAAKALAARGLPRADAPGRVAAARPAKGSIEDTVIGRQIGGTRIAPAAVGPCCDRPDWVAAFRVKNENRVPCCTCGRGVMTISDHAIH